MAAQFMYRCMHASVGRISLPLLRGCDPLTNEAYCLS